jgi:hypothetical protein
MPLEAALASIDIAVGSEKHASIVVPEHPPLLRVSPLALFALESPSAAAADNAAILSFSSPVDILAEVENEEEDDDEEEEDVEGREGSVPIHPFPPPLLLGG